MSQPPEFEVPPQSPDRTQPASFNTRTNAFLKYIVRFRDEIVAFTSWVVERTDFIVTKVNEALSYAQRAEAARDTAITVADAPEWTAQQFTLGDVVYSPINGQLYRCMVTHNAISVDPSRDVIRWTAISANGDELRTSLSNFAASVATNN